MRPKLFCGTRLPCSSDDIGGAQQPSPDLMRYSDKIDRIGVLAVQQAVVLDYYHSLSTVEWASPSECTGWTLTDVVAHMAVRKPSSTQPYL